MFKSKLNIKYFTFFALLNLVILQGIEALKNDIQSLEIEGIEELEISEKNQTNSTKQTIKKAAIILAGVVGVGILGGFAIYKLNQDPKYFEVMDDLIEKETNKELQTCKELKELQKEFASLDIYNDAALNQDAETGNKDAKKALKIKEALREKIGKAQREKALKLFKKLTIKEIKDQERKNIINKTGKSIPKLQRKLDNAKKVVDSGNKDEIKNLLKECPTISTPKEYVDLLSDVIDELEKTPPFTPSNTFDDDVVMKGSTCGQISKSHPSFSGGVVEE